MPVYRQPHTQKTNSYMHMFTLPHIRKHTYWGGTYGVWPAGAVLGHVGSMGMWGAHRIGLVDWV